jgi:hypothetical protein
MQILQTYRTIVVVVGFLFDVGFFGVFWCFLLGFFGGFGVFYLGFLGGFGVFYLGFLGFLLEHLFEEL